MHKTSHRLERIEALLLRELALLLQNDLEDPRVKSVTLTHATVSPDLSHAKIYFMTFNDAEMKDAEIALNKAAHYLRKKVATSIDLRVVPTFHFYYDQTLQQAQHVMDLIHQIPSDPEEKK